MGVTLAFEEAGVTTPACNLCGSAEHRPLFRKAGYDLVRCACCGLAFIANPPPEHEIARLYSVTNAYHAALLDPQSPEFTRMAGIARQHLAMLRKSVPEPRGLKLLDVGCSNGLFLFAARQAGFDVRGVELSADAARFARSDLLLNVTTGTWRDAGFADESFDVITLFDVTEHLVDPLGELAAIRRLLKPGGLLVQSTPDIDGLFPRLSYKAARWLDYWPHPEPPWHLFQFSAATLAAMTEKAGYAVTRKDVTSIHLSYSFGNPQSWKVSPKMLAYAALFAPSALIGRWIGKGDWLYLAARK